MTRPSNTPTLARLSFRVSPERMAEFEAAYKDKLAPILKRHGLVASTDPGRATVEDVFCRLFEVKAPPEVNEKWDALQGDPAWQEALPDLGMQGGPAFGIYAAPAGPGVRTPAGRGRGHWRTFDGVDGLPNTWAWAVFEDREGNLWFGTESGASRYDGRGFTTLTTRDGLAHNIVREIFQDREGHFWFGTPSGLSRYDGETFTTFTTEDGLSDDAIRFISQDREGNLWFGCGRSRPDKKGGGVSRYDGERFTTFTTEDGLASDYVRSIVQDREGNLWFGTHGGVSRYDGQTFRAFTVDDGLADNRVNAILLDREENLWFATGGDLTGGGVSRYDGERFTTFTSKDGLPDGAVSSVLQDWEGNLWFGTHGGVSRYDGVAFTTFTAGDGLAGNSVMVMHQDRERHLWFVTLGGGVSRYDGRTFTTFTTEEGLAGNFVRSIVQDREGHLWIATQGGGVSRYDGEAFTTFTIEEGLAGNFVRKVLLDREECLWFVTRGGGVSRYDGQAFTTYAAEDGLASNQGFTIAQDREGNLWLGTHGQGASRFDGRAWTTFTTEDGLAGNDIRAIVQDREGRLWFGTYDGGVGCYDGESFTTFTAEDGLASDTVFSAFEDREGCLWFGTWGAGVSRYDGRTWTTFTTQDGLSHNVVTTICQERDGHLWFGTEGGVSRYDGQTFQTLTREDGLSGNAVWSIFQDAEGDIWIGTANGLTRFRQPSPSPPPVFVDAVAANRRYEGVSELTVPATMGITAFEFHGMSIKTRPEAMVYRYRLVGYDEAWKNTRAQRVEYESLPLGEYTFEVVAVDRDLVYSESPATVRLTVVRDTRDEQIDELERRVRERTQELEEANENLVVEAALERVRAKALGMRNSEDISEVSAALFREFEGLEFSLFRSAIIIVDEERDIHEHWVTRSDGMRKVYQVSRKEFLERFPWAYEVEEARKQQQKHFVRESAGDALIQFYRVIREVFKIPEEEYEEIMRILPDRLVTHTIFFSYGRLNLAKTDRLSEDELAVAGRFAEVFEFAYARFLELQKAEGQARQAERRAAVDRVRAEIATMRTSADLERVTPLLWKEMTGVGVPFNRCGVFIMDEGEAQVRAYLADPQGGSLATLSLAFDSHPHVSRLVDSWRSKAVQIDEWDRQGFVDWMGFLEDQGQPVDRERYQGGDAPLERLVLHSVPFSQGMLYAGSASHLAEEDVVLVKDLAGAFSVAYARYVDFQRLEAQNRALEEANVQIQEANRLKSEFLARMSHELRTPMNAIIGFTRLVQRRGAEKLSERHRENLSKVRQSADHLLNLINDILDLSKVEAGRMDVHVEQFDVSKLIGACCVTVSPMVKPGVRLTQEVADRVGEAQTDAVRLRQIVTNLLSNAVKFTDGGEVSVRVGLNSETGGSTSLMIAVSDTGIGIPEDSLEAIFDEFRQVDGSHTRKHQGTGLGLSITKRLTELLGGTISVESEVGKGSTFTVSVPVVYRGVEEG